MRGTAGIVASLTLLVGCGPPPELVQERDDLKRQVGDLTSKNEKLEREADGLTSKVRMLEGKLQAAADQDAANRLGLKPGGRLSATFETSKGAIHCELLPDKAPKTVLNFVQLAEGTKEWEDPRLGGRVKKPLYDGTIFHRVIPEFMIQGGDPLGNGSGGPGYEFEDETDNGLVFDRPTLLAMANRGPDTNGSQFFITDRAKPDHLNGKHTIFGRCEDAGVVQAIATAKAGPRNKPKDDIVLKRVVIERTGG